MTLATGNTPEPDVKEDNSAVVRKLADITKLWEKQLAVDNDSNHAEDFDPTYSHLHSSGPSIPKAERL
jgi:hypothetical protein